MKRMFTIFGVFALFFAAYFSSVPVYSQAQEEEISDGTDFWFGVPVCGRDRAEPIRWGQYPVDLWVSSKVKTRFTIESPGGVFATQTFEVMPNQVKSVSLTEMVINTQSEVAEDKGIHLFSNDPVNVAVFVAYKWSGEAYRVTPTAWLGKEYFTLNMYQDRVKMYSGVTENKPPQILIVATQNGTAVTYYPTYTTQFGVKAGKSRSVTLNKGQTFLILGKCTDTDYQQWYTDLTGSRIVSSAPIACISGHTKAAFPRFSVSLLGIRSDFMRNMLMEMMWPVELLGTDYVMAPIRYLNRSYNAGNIIENFKGDLVRIVAAYDSTVIWQMRSDGTGLRQISVPLKMGQELRIDEQEKPAFFHATKPVLVGQYGKAWWLNSVPASTDKKGETPLNPPRNGQGMLLTLAPIDHWCSYGSFKSPEGMDNFVYITFETDKLKDMKFDGNTFQSIWGSAVKVIEGTPYSYVAENIAPGSHRIEGMNGAKFAGYAYGNWDSSKDGFAYGYPVGINYATPCDDELQVEDIQVCGNVDGIASVTPVDSACAKIFSVQFWTDRSFNYEFTSDKIDPTKAKNVKFQIKILDPYDSAKAVISVTTRSGKTVWKTYTYYPEDVVAEPTTANFGLLQVGDKVTKVIKLTNPTDIDITINNIKFKGKKPEFSYDNTVTFPIILKAKQSIEINFYGTALQLSNFPVFDSVIVELSCYEKTVARVELKTGEPIVWIGDAYFGAVPVNVEKPKLVEIVNQGSSPVELSGITYPDKTPFRCDFDSRDLSTNPIRLTKPGEKYQFTVYYTPKVAGVQDSTRAIFTGNTDKVKLYSDWVGIGIEAGPIIDGYDWQRQRVIDAFAGVTSYPGNVVVGNVGNTKLSVDQIKIENDADGVFELDATMANSVKELNPNDKVTIKATFAPKLEKEYFADVIIYADDNGVKKQAKAVLHGIGTQPHVEITSIDYGPAIYIGQTRSDFSYLTAPLKNNLTAMELTITKLEIKGTDAAAFQIDNSFFTKNPYPIKMQPNDQLKMPVTFTAVHPGDHIATITTNDDAPEDPEGNLMGRGYFVGVQTINKDLGTLFITKNNVDSVNIVNTGSDKIYLRDIQLRGTNVNEFSIKSIRSEMVGMLQQSNLKGWEFKKDDKIWVAVDFAPRSVGNFKAQIEYDITLKDSKLNLDKDSTAISEVIGVGQILKSVCQIPILGDRIPGEAIMVDVIMKKHSEEAKKLIEAGITEFKVKVIFKSPSHNPAVVDIYPEVEGPQDIFTVGTLTENFTVEYVSVDSKEMIIHFKGNQPLAFSGISCNTGVNGDSCVLFRFNLYTYLSGYQDIPIPVEFEAPYPWVFVDEIPGAVSIKPVCVNVMRLITINSTHYSLIGSNPNPAGDITTISYSLGLEGPTTLELYNSYGDKVATLIDEVQKAGAYDFQLYLKNLNLASGTYFMRLNSHFFTETKPLIIVK
ncbi:MAG: Choice-of-anchor protein [Ignavibacteria bacterium]|nr:Choice-of-anchor protein [Ignavibacteria bacterium]